MAASLQPWVARPVQLSDGRKNPLGRKDPKRRSPKKVSRSKNFLLQSFRSQVRTLKDGSIEKPSSLENQLLSKEKKVWNQDDEVESEAISMLKVKRLKALAEIEEEKQKMEIVLSDDDDDISVGNLSADSESDSSSGSSDEDEGKAKEECQRATDSKDKEDADGKDHAAANPGIGWANELERLAMEEILREAKRAGEVAKETGVWLKPAVPSTNKRFLRNMLVSTLKNPIRTRKKPLRGDSWYMKSQADHGDKLWEDRQKRTNEMKQMKEEEWRDYKNSSYFGSHRRYDGYDRVTEKCGNRNQEEPSERDKYEQYRSEQKRLRMQCESQYNMLREEYAKAGHHYQYERKKWRDDSVKFEDNTGDVSDPDEGYFDFKDVFGEKSEQVSNEKWHKPKKHKREKKKRKKRKHNYSGSEDYLEFKDLKCESKHKVTRKCQRHRGEACDSKLKERKHSRHKNA